MPSEAALASHLWSPWRKHAFDGDCTWHLPWLRLGSKLLPRDELAQSDWYGPGSPLGVPHSLGTPRGLSSIQLPHFVLRAWHIWSHLDLLTLQLFVDKDTIVNAVGASHDIHLLKIDNREDELVTGINSWCAQLLDKVTNAKPPSRLAPVL